MKARIKGTDAVISVQPIYSVDGLHIEQFVNTANGDLFQPHTVDIIPNDTDWNALRNQAAIACLAQIVGNIPSDIQGDYTEAYVEEAINYADELVKQLKEK